MPLRRPAALLLDYGGVIITSRSREGGAQAMAEHVSRVLQRAGIDGEHADPARLRHSIEAGGAALKDWKNASSRPREPRELTHRELVGDFYFSDLDDRNRAVLVGDAEQLLFDFAAAMSDHILRDGIVELLTYARDEGIPVGIVSNAHSGRAHRTNLDNWGLSDLFGVQVYSDEAGIRKPHPDMIHRAATALGVDAADCWYVGDTQDRDVVAGRRAGVGAVLLTREKHTDSPPFPVAETADAIFDSPVELLAALREATPDAIPAVDEPTPMPGPAVLLDHGGVVSLSEPHPEHLDDIVAAVDRVLERAGRPLPVERIRELITAGHQRYKEVKKSRTAPEAHYELQADEFWGDIVAAELDEPRRAVLLAASRELQTIYYRSRSAKRLRSGARELLEFCSGAGVPVVMVSNTINGRAVRQVLADHGVEEHVSAWVFSDELGLRKPHPGIFADAIAMTGRSPEQLVMVGDKPVNDADGARQAGIAGRVLVRGGSTDDTDLERALEDGVATHVFDDAAGTIEVLEAMLR